MSEVQTLRWYTRARKLPRLIGKLPGGGQIIGGPYTPVQFIGAASVLVVGNQTIGLWGMWSGLVNYVVLGLVAIATLFGLGMVKSSGRNPVAAAFSLLSAASAPRLGTYRGKALKTPKPHLVTSRVVCPVREPLEVAQLAHEEDLTALDVETAPEPMFFEPVAVTPEPVPVAVPVLAERDVVETVDADVPGTRPRGALDSIPARSRVPMSNIQRALVDLNLEGRAS